MYICIYVSIYIHIHIYISCKQTPQLKFPSDTKWQLLPPHGSQDHREGLESLVEIFPPIHGSIESMVPMWANVPPIFFIIFHEIWVDLKKGKSSPEISQMFP